MYLYVDYPSFLSPYVIKGLPVRWYAVMYLFAFATAWLVYRREIKIGRIRTTEDDTFDIFFYGIIGLLLGARLFSVLIYDSDRLYYISHPWMIFWPFQNGVFVGLPGMSYHGGVVGIVISLVIYSRKTQKKALRDYRSNVARFGKKKADSELAYKKELSFFGITDALLLGIPLGYTFGRLGNFFNAELYGRVTTSPVGMLFPDAEKLSTAVPWVREMADKLGLSYTPGGLVNIPRHPSQLYEALFEGILLFLLMWFVFRPVADKKKKNPGFLTGVYLIGYGFFRFVIEYFREPDANLGYIINGGSDRTIELFTSLLNISMGQILCFLMIVGGILIIILTGKRKER